MTPCSPLNFNRRFGGTYRLHLQGRKNRFSKPAIKQVASCVISQKMILFITTAVKTSNPTTINFLKLTKKENGKLLLLYKTVNISMNYPPPQKKAYTQNHNFPCKGLGTKHSRIIYRNITICLLNLHIGQLFAKAHNSYVGIFNYSMQYFQQ
jgi:hypothetical protein